MISSADDLPRVVTPGAEQAWNERQLAAGVRKPRFRVWAYRVPAVVLGCAQRGQFAAQGTERDAGVGLVDRRAGGGAVLVGPWMLSASVAMPAAHEFVSSGVAASYRWVGELHASVLLDLGIAATVLQPAAARCAKPDADLGWACFGVLSPWEVMVDGRKIVGLAQVRRRTGVLLVSGTLLARPNWDLLCRALGKPDRHAEILAESTSSCADELGRAVSAGELGRTLIRALREALGTDEATFLGSSQLGAAYA